MDVPPCPEIFQAVIDLQNRVYTPVGKRREDIVLLQGVQNEGLFISKKHWNYLSLRGYCNLAVNCCYAMGPLREYRAIFRHNVVGWTPRDWAAPDSMG